jgi:hypothetical protein
MRWDWGVISEMLDYSFQHSDRYVQYSIVHTVLWYALLYHTLQLTSDQNLTVTSKCLCTDTNTHTHTLTHTLSLSSLPLSHTHTYIYHSHTRTHIHVRTYRLSEALKAKWVKRVSSFFKCAGDSPFGTLGTYLRYPSSVCVFALTSGLCLCIIMSIYLSLYFDR